MAKVKKDVLQPTRQQVQEHLDSNHAIFRNWCAICVAAQGLPKPHQRSWKTLEERAKEPDRLSSDYYFMSTKEDTAPNIVCKVSRSGRSAATSLPCKGGSEYGVKWLTNLIKMVGFKRFENWSDGEHALVNHKTLAANACPELSGIQENHPLATISRTDKSSVRSGR